MKPLKIAINGLGRIGRCVLRILAEHPRESLQVIAVNAPAEIEMSAHLVKYDSIHGVLPFEVASDGETLSVNGKAMRYCRHRSPEDLPWREMGVDLVLECTGLFNDGKRADAHLRAGAAKVIISAPAKNVDMTVVYGINHTGIGGDMRIISNASCTTNCLAPMAKVLHDSFGVVCGLMNTVHAFTRDQRLVDSTHADYRRARAATASIIPTKTGAAAAIGLVLPELAGKLSGIAVRVPTPNVSLVDLTCLLERPATPESVNDAFRQAAAGDLSGILAANDLPLVSTDFNGRSESSIIDLAQTQMMEGGLTKTLAWYDNEWGFACRMLDTALAMHHAG